MSTNTSQTLFNEVGMGLLFVAYVVAVVWVFHLAMKAIGPQSPGWQRAAVGDAATVVLLALVGVGGFVWWRRRARHGSGPGD
jgi:hypothetical protein